MLKISRPCYDKFHRCPGWIGGGMKSARKVCCTGGRISVDYNSRLWKWKMWPCDTCDVIVLPYMVRWIDPTNVIWEIKFWWKYRK